MILNTWSVFYISLLPIVICILILIYMCRMKPKFHKHMKYSLNLIIEEMSLCMCVYIYIKSYLFPSSYLDFSQVLIENLCQNIT